MMVVTDVLVIGSGIAGLSFALKAAQRFPDKTITIITKNDDSESNTRYAQGGIAVALDGRNDSFEKHVADTLKAGDGLNKKEVVELVVREGPARLQELLRWHIPFDHDDSGSLTLGCEGGHSAHRIIHAKDATGYHISASLLTHLKEFKNAQLYPHHFAVDLVIQDGSCIGVVAVDQTNGTVERFLSRATVLATGGAGQVYRTTTNPTIATGDGISMAYRAGAIIRDMEFVQFHPTAFYSETDNPSFLISEALRGFGAWLVTKHGERFLFRYDERGELASRDIISKAIVREMKEHFETHVFLDCRHLPSEELIYNFPTIYNKCLEKGIDFTKQLVPVAPAAHYVCGGTETDVWARTSIPHLYACGECAFTGLHGANRLASNSLLEALVFAHRCFVDVEKVIEEIKLPGKVEWKTLRLHSQPIERSWILRTRSELRNIMSEHVGIVRSFESLHHARSKVGGMFKEAELFYNKNFSIDIAELRNMITVSLLVIDHALHRQENKGTHFNIDLNKEHNPVIL